MVQSTLTGKYFQIPMCVSWQPVLFFILLTLLIGTRDYCGSSMPLIERSMEGEIGYEAFFLKMLFTAIALGAGFKGGEIVPTLCVGAAFWLCFLDRSPVLPLLYVLPALWLPYLRE